MKYDGISAMPMFYIRVDARKSAWNRKLNTIRKTNIWDTLLVCKSFNAIKFIWSKMEFFLSIKKKRSLQFTSKRDYFEVFDLILCVCVCSFFRSFFNRKFHFVDEIAIPNWNWLQQLDGAASLWSFSQQFLQTFLLQQYNKHQKMHENTWNSLRCDERVKCYFKTSSQISMDFDWFLDIFKAFRSKITSNPIAANACDYK